MHMLTAKKIVILLFSAALFYGCRDRYFANYTMPDTGYLVVSGFISNGETPTEIRLSRTTRLTETPSEIMEKDAIVSVQSDANEHYPLQEVSEGVYIASYIQIDPKKKYRIAIRAKGKQYESAYTIVQQTPDIDSISWQQASNGIDFSVHTHDESNASRYYQWMFEDTWEIQSRYLPTLQYLYDGQNRITGVGYKFADERADTTMRRCWATGRSRTTLLGSTEKLTKDVISAPVHFVQAGSEKMQVVYSLLVKQYKLSSEAYNFRQMMKKNSEQLGSVFDPQPSLLRGNIRCVSNPAETVIGFIEVTQQKEKRIILKREELKSWDYMDLCYQLVIANNPDSIAKYGAALVPTTVDSVHPKTLEIRRYAAAPPQCVDCRLNNATTTKPAFWPN
jgi:hypothetical protein